MTQLRDVLYYYQGCEFQRKESGSIYKIIGNVETILTLKSKQGSIIKLNMVYGKLILRRIESMTEEEKKELRILMHGMTSENLLPKIAAGPIIDLFVNKRDPQIIHWLLSKGFDLFGLIDSGQAIEKK